MNAEKVNGLKGGDVIRDQNGAVGVVVDFRLYSKNKNKPVDSARIQWLGGGASIWSTRPQDNAVSWARVELSVGVWTTSPTSPHLDKASTA